MLWNRFDKERSKLDLYRNPNFEPGTGISDIKEIYKNVREFADTLEGESHPIIKAKCMEYILDNAAIEVNPLDWFGLNFCGWVIRSKSLELGIDRHPLYFLVERWIVDPPQPPEVKAAIENVVETGTMAYGCDYHHSVPDWDSVIGLGFKGILERAEKYKNKHIEEGTLTPEKEDYYQSIDIVYNALIRILDRFYECAKKHINDDEKMPIMVECLGALRDGAPKTLYQYLMLTYLYHTFQEYLDYVQVRTLGNLDVDGYPFYKADLESGRLTKENAEELIRYFYEKFSQQGHQHGQPMYFGGFDENGDSLINELSYVMLEAFDKSCIVSPKLFIKVMPNTPDEFLKKALDMIRRGKNCIVFVNEELGCEMSRKLGRTEEETRRLVATGCNNFESRGNATTPEHVYVNLAKGIELAFNNGVDPISGAKMGCETGDVSEFKTFDDFRNAYLAQTDYLIDKALIISDFSDVLLEKTNPAPLYSGAMHESVKCGRDAYYNGAKYNNTNMFLSCHATVADSLMMVKKYVYDLKKYSIEELKKALLANWVGYEDMRDTLYNDTEKFGNDIESVDTIAVETIKHFSDKVMGRKNLRGGQYVANGESIWFSHRWADMCGATPDGRARGDLLSKNMSASIAQDRKGITAHIKSVTKIDATGLTHGCPFDYMLHPSAVKGEDGLNAMLGLLRVFMKRGGYGYQGNVQDAEILKDAQKHPKNIRIFRFVSAVGVGSLHRWKRISKTSL